MLNSAALAMVADALDDSLDVERDDFGVPTGRLWRYDTRLRAALPATPPDLPRILTELRSLGITSVTDATPDLDAEAVRLLSEQPLPVTLLGDPAADTAWKVVLRDHDLPSYVDLRSRIVDVRAAGRPVAVHCVTRESLLLTLAVLDDVGRRPGDRIEHGAVIPDPGALHGLRVVTQPGFLSDRGDDYLSDVRADDLACLYRYRSLLAAGIDVLPSSDAPYGPLDPWLVMRAARDRRTRAGRTVGAEERVDVARVLDGYLCDADGRRRRVRVGEPARLVLLAAPLGAALAEPSRDAVVETFG
jgi:predicted amidohydrolase YtcJ